MKIVINATLHNSGDIAQSVQCKFKFRFYHEMQFIKYCVRSLDTRKYAFFSQININWLFIIVLFCAWFTGRTESQPASQPDRQLKPRQEKERLPNEHSKETRPLIYEVPWLMYGGRRDVKINGSKS